jgi:outer membrane protein TolC
LVRLLPWVGVFLLGLGILSPGAASAPLTLEEAILTALRHHPGLKAAGWEVTAAEAEVARARARFLPRLEVTESYTWSNSPSQVFMSKLNQRRFAGEDFLLDNLNHPSPYGNFRTALTLSQPLFQAGEAALGYQQAKLTREMARAQGLKRRQEVIFQVIRAFFGLHLARERHRVLTQALETARRHRELVHRRYEAGAAIRADALSAEVHLAKIRQEEMQAAAQVGVSQSALDTAVGKPETASRPLAPAPGEPAPLPPRREELLQVAQARRPDLQELRLAAQAAHKETQKARLNHLPRARLVAEYDVDQRRLFGPSGDSFTVMALLHLNLFNGLADLARQRESAAREATARELERELLDHIRHQVTEAALHLKTARERYQVATTVVTEARESLRLIRLRYEEGLTLLLDLLSAEDAAKEADLRRLEALFDTHLAHAGLELALGTLSGPPAGSTPSGSDPQGRSTAP